MCTVCWDRSEISSKPISDQAHQVWQILIAGTVWRLLTWCLIGPTCCWPVHAWPHLFSLLLFSNYASAFLILGLIWVPHNHESRLVCHMAVSATALSGAGTLIFLIQSILTRSHGHVLQIWWAHVSRAKSPALPLPALRLHHCAWQQHTLGSMLKLNLARLPRISIAPPLLAYTTP